MIATLEATYSFAKKFPHYKDFYIKHNDLVFSKLGLELLIKNLTKKRTMFFII